MIHDVSRPTGAALLERAARRFGRAGEPGAYLASGSALALVAVDDARPERILGWAYGYVLPRPDGTSMAYLHAIDVADDVRRRGHGGTLLDAFLATARARGATKAFLVTDAENAPARALYESRGGGTSDGGAPATYWFPLSSPGLR